MSIFISTRHAPPYTREERDNEWQIGMDKENQKTHNARLTSIISWQPRIQDRTSFGDCVDSEDWSAKGGSKKLNTQNLEFLLQIETFEQKETRLQIVEL